MIIQGDCLEVLPTLEAGSVHACVTSPPYFGLRKYGDAEGEMGSEPTPEDFVTTLVSVFREVRRVLRDDGTVWINLGDTYAANRSYQVPSTKGGKKHSPAQGNSGGMRVPAGLKQKDLIGIPWKVAFALQSDGWFLRQEIIWYKPNGMPENVKDRCDKAHEHIFLLSKCKTYYFDADAIKEPSVSKKGNSRSFRGGGAYTGGQSFRNDAVVSRRTKGNKPNESGMRNKRSVWSVATEGYAGAHFATFPKRLIEPCILAGAPKGGFVLDPFAGAGTTWLAASDLGRKFIGIELYEKNVEMANERFANHARGRDGFSLHSNIEARIDGGQLSLL